MKIKSCSSESDPIGKGAGFNKKVTDFLSGTIKRKKQRQDDNTASLVCLSGYQYDEQHHHGNRMFVTGEVKYNSRECTGVNYIKLMHYESDKIKETAFKSDIIRYGDGENTVSESSGMTPVNVISAEEQEDIPAEKKYHPGGDRCDTNIIRTADTPVALPVFLNHPLSGGSPGTMNLPLRHHEPAEKVRQEIAQDFCYSGENPLSRESGQSDYYCYYFFRQKHQLPEPVYIYREKPGRFKLEIYSDPLKRRLKSEADINGIDNIDIL